MNYKTVEHQTDIPREVWSMVTEHAPYNATPLWFEYTSAYQQREVSPCLTMFYHGSHWGACVYSVDEHMPSMGGAPLCLITPPEIPLDVSCALERGFVVWLENRFKNQQFKVVGSPWVTKSLWSKSKHSHGLHGHCDLRLKEELLWQAIRKSYRSLIKWGKENLSLHTMTAANFCSDTFDRFKQLHIAAAGRSTRSNESWDVQAKQIRAGEAFLVTATIDGRLVVGLLNLIGGGSAFYAVAASDRNLMAQNKPLSHAPLWISMQHAKGIGLKNFCFGDLAYSDEEKIIDINSFKRGFCTDVVPKLVLEVKL